MKITLMKFGAEWCGPCVALAKRGTLEKFQKAHPDVRVEVHDDNETGSSAWERLSDKWNVKSIPVLIWLARGEELFRSSDVTAAGIEKQYQQAVRKAENG